MYTYVSILLSQKYFLFTADRPPLVSVDIMPLCAEWVSTVDGCLQTGSRGKVAPFNFTVADDDVTLQNYTASTEAHYNSPKRCFKHCSVLSALVLLLTGQWDEFQWMSLALAGDTNGIRLQKKTLHQLPLSWNVLSLHPSSFTVIPSPVSEGHGGMV